MEPDLACPAADVEGEGEPDKDIDCGEENNVTCREPPRKKGQCKERNAVGRQGNGRVAEPSAAEGNMAVLVVHVEPVYLPEEKDGEDQMGEFVRERHHPTGVVPRAGKQVQEEEGDKADAQVTVELHPGGRDGFQSYGSRKDSNGKKHECGQQDAVDDMEHLSEGLQDSFSFRIHMTKISIPLISAKKLFTFGRF